MGIGETIGAALSGANPVTAIANVVESVINRIWEDPVERQKAKIELTRLEENGDLQRMAAAAGLDQGQIDVNKIEAASPSLFVSGWRPAIGWVCVAALAMFYVPRFAVGMVLWTRLAWDAQGTLPPLPDMGIADVLGLVGTLLGASTIRMMERKWGVARTA